MGSLHPWVRSKDWVLICQGCLGELPAQWEVSQITSEVLSEAHGLL